MNKEERKEYNKKYRKENPDYFKKWRKENKEKVIQYQKEYAKKYYQKNKEKVKKDVKRWKKENPKKIKERDKKYKKENPEKIKEIRKKWDKENPEKIKAHNLANKKIKIPKEQKCEICHKNLATEKHHPDYSKPLEVMFLCRKCHINIHKMENKTKERSVELLNTKNKFKGLKKYCLNYLIDNFETKQEIKGFISDLLNHGCVSGMVSGLISFKDTNDFYDKYEEEIEDLLNDYKESVGFKSRNEAIDGLNGTSEDMKQQKNLLAWFGFEDMMGQINEEFKINKEFL